MFYTDDGGIRRCYSIAEGLRRTLLKNNIVNVLNQIIDRATATDAEMEKFLTAVHQFARSEARCCGWGSPTINPSVQ